jgi:hypothetical protein
MEGQQVEIRRIPGIIGYKVGNDGSLWSAWYYGQANGLASVLGDGEYAKWKQLRIGSKHRHEGRRIVLFAYGAPKRRYYYIGNLVLEAFVSPKPGNNYYCHYLDGNRENDCLENLEWRSYAQLERPNTRTAPALTEVMIKRIERARLPAIRLAKKLGVHRRTIGLVRKRAAEARAQKLASKKRGTT